MTKKRGGSRQGELIPRSQQPTIPIDASHRLVLLTDRLDWTDLMALVQEIRRSKLKNDAGRPPRLRATTGALVLNAMRKMPLRELEDYIRYYAPARYVCGLTETDWTPD